MASCEVHTGEAGAASVAAPSAGKITIAWYKASLRGRVSRASKPVLVAQGTKKFTKAGAAVLKLRLTGSGRALLKHSTHLTLIAVGTFTPRHGKPSTRRKSITLKSH